MASRAGLSPLESSSGVDRGEFRELSTLLEVSQALSTTLDLKVGLQSVLDVLARHHGAIRTTVVLRQEDTGDLVLEASAGSVRPGRRVRYAPGEGITGQVMQRGEPIVVPRVSREPMFLGRMAERSELRHQELSYICAPISLDGKTVGAIGVDLHYEADRDYRRAAKFLGVVGAMIGQAVKMHRLFEVDRKTLADENAHLRDELKERYDFSKLVGTSGSMRQVYEQVAQVAPTNTTVLLRGESGTGKELIAHAIHHHSTRAKQPFVKVSCAALPQDLIESELFGYEKGAFTGAAGTKKGRFEMANNGTLFLDEIGELSHSTQVKLLRVLQEREFERLGGTQTIRVNLRLVAATNKDLEKAIAAGEFREDLYYRLNVFAIYIAPLRERKSDMLLLVDHFLEKFSREHGKDVRRISTPAIDMLTAYHWPGNVRELANVIERAVVVCDASVVHAHHLPLTLQTAEATGTTNALTLAEIVERVERDAIQDALKSSRGNRAKAARLLATTGRIFNYKVRGYGIDWRRFKG